MSERENSEKSHTEGGEMELQHMHADGTPFTAEEMAAVRAQREEDRKSMPKGLEAMADAATRAENLKTDQEWAAKESKAKEAAAKKAAEREARRVEMMRQGYIPY